MSFASILSGGFFTNLFYLQCAATATALVCAYSSQSFTRRLDRPWVFRFGVAWALLVTLEYWALGDRSYSAIAAEADYSITGFMMMAQQPAGARWAPGFAGGNDLYAFATFSGQLVSLERFLIANLPLGLANFAHKALVAGIGFLGSYKLCRSWCKEDRVMPLLLAALFTLSHERVTIMTWSHGLGFALAPLMVYLFVCRQGKRHYWAGVIASSAVNAISCTPTHSYLAVISGVLAVAVLRERAAAWKTVAALAISLLFVTANWHEAFYAKFLIGPYTSRGSVEPERTILPSATYLLIALAGVTLTYRNSRGVGRSLLALGVGLLAGDLAQWFATHVPAFKAIRSVNFGNMQAGFFAVATAVLARGWQPRFEDTSLGSGSVNAKARGAAALLLLAAVTFGNLVWYKAYNILTWLSEGGLSTVSGSVAQIRGAAWIPEQPTRVVSVPYRLPANVASAAGLETFDGVYPLVLSSIEAFWNAVLYPKSVDAASAYLDMSGSGVDFKCCPFYTPADFLNLDLLRLANVGYMLSIVPLRGPGVTPVVRDDNVSLPRNTDPPSNRLLGYLGALKTPPRVLVYSLGDPTPRIYVARSIRRTELHPGSREFYELASSRVRSHEIVVADRERVPSAEPLSDADILSVAISGNEASVTLRSQGAGVLVLNAPYTAFWRAYADGNAVPLVPANGIQMAAFFPENTKSVIFRYERPLLRERLVSFFVGDRP